MMKQKLLNLLRIALAVAVLCLVGFGAQAKADFTIGNTFSAQWNGYTAGTGQVQFSVSDAVTVAPNISTTAGGLMKYSYTDSSGTNSFYSMCIDLSQYVASNNNFTVSTTVHSQSASGPAIGNATANALGWLWNTTNSFGPYLQDNGKTLFARVIDWANTADDPSNIKNLVAGALQLTTWKLVYDGETAAAFALEAGHMIITEASKSTAEYALAQSFLTAIKNQVESTGISGWGDRVTALISPSQQDQLIFYASAVPEPATMMIWGIMGGLGAACAMRMKRRELVV